MQNAWWRYPESPGSSQTSHGAAHVASWRVGRYDDPAAAVTPTGSLGVRNDPKRLRRLAPGLCTLEVEGAHVRQVLEHWGGKAKQLTDLGLGLVQLPKVQRVVLMADLRPPVGEEE